MSLKKKLAMSLNEKDVENAYRSELLTLEKSAITSPYKVDGLLEAKNVRALLEFKYDDSLKNKLSQCNILIQCLYYLKKFEDAGDKIPTTIFVGDINECFALHTNSIVKYLAHEIDWKVAPSIAHKVNPALIQAMVGDTDILPFVFDIDDSFSIKTAIAKIKDFSDNVIRKVRITKHNVVSIFDYFERNIIMDLKLTTNEKANLFIQIIINPNENYLHPKLKNTMVSKSFGELKVIGIQFKSFFQHFEGDVYSPKEKEGLTALVDRLVEDSVRRNKGEFFTPTPFVDLAHKYVSDTFGEDWKDKYVVWDCACGTGNLTRDYQFKELYLSTLEQSDLDTATQMGYNPEATKFQYDFLNDTDDKLPQGLRDAIAQGKEILFLINPPYATSSNLKLGDTSKKDVEKTVQNGLMKSLGYGDASKNLYSQFLFKISSIQKINKNTNIGVFSPLGFLTGSKFDKFRNLFFNDFGYSNGFLFEACHFSDVAKNWGILFSTFKSGGATSDTFKVEVIDFDSSFELFSTGAKALYNTDSSIRLNDWARRDTKGIPQYDAPQLSTGITVKPDGYGKLCAGALGYLWSCKNIIESNATSVAMFTSTFSGSNSNGWSIFPTNFKKATTLLSVRKMIEASWLVSKDEYLAPNEAHTDYAQFTNDSVVYSLFNNSSQQSSLRQVDYKGKKWDIKNEFFWMSKAEMQALAEQSNYDAMYKDAKQGADRHVYSLISGGLVLSADAQKVLDMATDLLKKSMVMRKAVAEEHPEYHLDSFDAGYAQLKLVWKEYFKDDFKAFREAYKALEDRMRPLVYELGFLKV